MKYVCQFSVFVVGVFLTLPVALYADGCRVVGRSYQTSYSAPYVAPTYQNYQTYNNYTAIPYPVEVRTFFQVAPDLAQIKINQTIAEEAAEKSAQKIVDKLLAEQRKLQTQQTQPRPTVEDPTSAGNDDPLAGLPISYGTANSPQNVPHNQHQTVKAIFDAHCTKCHGQGDKLDLTRPDLVPRAVRKKIDGCVSHEDGYKQMPPKMPKIQAAEREVIREYVYSRTN